MATAILLPGRLRETLRRHPWVYPESVKKVDGTYANGDVIRVASQDGKFVAHAFVNDRSRLMLRLVSFVEDEKIDAAFVRARVRSASELREKTLALAARTNAYRVVHSEADGLPGLIVDRMNDALVVSCTSLGMQGHIDAVLDELEEIYRPRAILEVGKALGLRGKEGLPEGRGYVRGKAPEEETRIEVDGVVSAVPLEVGQKTGLFLDQRENVKRVAELARGKTLLDACCYGGAFAISALKAGALRAELFDTSDKACDLARRNCALNGVADRAEVRRADLYPELRRLKDAGAKFDVVVLDPPKFASTQREVAKARAGYVNGRAGFLDVIDAQRSLLEFQLAGVEARTQRELALASL
ncbi:MAG: class I SAM-dependent methyltransferase, partial [Planctomycetota bacterium]